MTEEIEIPIGGRIKHFYQFWSKIYKDHNVLREVARSIDALS